MALHFTIHTVELGLHTFDFLDVFIPGFGATFDIVQFLLQLAKGVF